MGLKAVLLPAEGRTFPGKRWVNIGLRTVHLVGIAGAGGGVLFGAPPEACLPYLVATAASGAGLILLDLWTSCIWVVQVRGLGILAKLGILACLGALPGYGAHILALASILSSIVAHAPARLRYFSVIHWRQVDTWERRDQARS
jgi:hypothetical protein